MKQLQVIYCQFGHGSGIGPDGGSLHGHLCGCSEKSRQRGRFFSIRDAARLISFRWAKEEVERLVGCEI